MFRQVQFQHLFVYHFETIAAEAEKIKFECRRVQLIFCRLRHECSTKWIGAVDFATSLCILSFDGYPKIRYYRNIISDDKQILCLRPLSIFVNTAAQYMIDFPNEVYDRFPDHER